MFSVAVLSLALAASPMVGTKGLSTFGVKEDVGQFFTVSLQKELLQQGVELIVRPDADVQGQPSVCGDGKPCAFVLRGTIAQLGDSTRLELELVAPDGKRVARHTAKAADVASLADQLPAMAEALAKEINGAPATVPAQPTPSATTSAPTETPAAEARVGEAPSWWWAPLLIGVVLIGAGAGCFAVAASDHDSLIGGTAPAPLYSYDDGKAIVSHGKLFEALGWTGIGVGAAAAVASAAIWYFGRGAPIALTVSPHGAYASLELHW